MFGISENGSYLFSITIGYNQEAGQMSFRETSMGKCVVNGCNESYNHAATKKSHIYWLHVSTVVRVLSSFIPRLSRLAPCKHLQPNLNVQMKARPQQSHAACHAIRPTQSPNALQPDSTFLCHFTTLMRYDKPRTATL